MLGGIKLGDVESRPHAKLVKTGRRGVMDTVRPVRRATGAGWQRIVRTTIPLLGLGNIKIPLFPFWNSRTLANMSEVTALR